jgi:hypothetical protein
MESNKKSPPDRDRHNSCVIVGKFSALRESEQQVVKA